MGDRTIIRSVNYLLKNLINTVRFKNWVCYLFDFKNFETSFIINYLLDFLKNSFYWYFNFS
jgi:hypothetical protein